MLLVDSAWYQSSRKYWSLRTQIFRKADYIALKLSKHPMAESFPQPQLFGGNEDGHLEKCDTLVDDLDDDLYSEIFVALR